MRRKRHCEYEFFLFEETPHSVREKGFKNLKNITPGFFGYSVLRASVHAEFYEHLLELCEMMRMPLEGLHTETGPGVLEAAITYSDALEGADRAALFKTFTKVLAERRGWMATFMAKWSRDWPGQSGHLHISLKDRKGRAVFHDPKNKPHADVRRDALVHRRPAGADAGAAGDGRLDRELLHAAHSRLLGADRRDLGRRQPHLRAARHSRLGEVAAGRVSDRRRRHQSLCRARCRDRLRPMGHRAQDRARQADRGKCLCAYLPEEAAVAAHAVGGGAEPEGSKAARTLFGDAFVEHYAATREWEEREFRKAITDWELARYFEII